MSGATGGGSGPPVSSFVHQAASALAAQSCRQWHPLGACQLQLDGVIRNCMPLVETHAGPGITVFPDSARLGNQNTRQRETAQKNEGAWRDSVCLFPSMSWRPVLQQAGRRISCASYHHPYPKPAPPTPTPAPL